MKEFRIDRRHFLKGSASWGAGLGLANFLSGCSSLDRVFGPDPGRYEGEVLIVGAGLAGLTAAYELKKRKIPFRVIEASSRPGGRVYTLNHFNPSGHRAELGGDHIDPRHGEILKLCSELNLTVENAASPRGLSSFFWKGQLLPSSRLEPELAPSLRELLQVRSEITDGMPADVFAFGAEGNTKARERDQQSVFDLVRGLKAKPSDRAAQYLLQAARAQFGREANEQSALQFLASLDPSPRAGGTRRLQGGTEALTRTLYERIKGVLPEFFVRFNTPLKSIRDLGSRFECRVQTPRGTQTIWARFVIFAVPPAALRRVEGWDTLKLAEARKSAIRGMKLGTHSRLILGFDERFWTSSAQGPVLEGALLGLPSAQSFFEASRGLTGDEGVLSFTVGGEEGAKAGVELTAQALKDLQSLWRRSPAAWNKKQVLKNWSRQSGIEGSLLSYGPGEMTRWNGAFLEGDYEDRLIFAGEHTSERSHGSLQGAVESGQRAAALAAKAVEKFFETESNGV